MLKIKQSGICVSVYLPVSELPYCVSS